MAPMGLGISVAFLASGMLRAGGGRDVYASVFREWVLAAGVGLGALAAAWWAGANLAGLAFVMAVGLLAASAVLLVRPEVTVRPRRLIRPADDAARRKGRVTIVAGYAAVAAALAVQARLLTDVYGASLGAVSAWAGGSLVLLWWGLRRWDRRSRRPGRLQAIGAAAGAGACLMLQAGLLLGGLAAGGAGRAVPAVLAAAAQVPLAQLAAGLISRQRRRFAAEGGRARAYVASAAVGLAWGIGLYALLVRLWWGPVVMLAGVLVSVTASVLRGIAISRRAVVQLRWALWGGVLMVSAAAAPILVVRQVGRRLGPVRQGLWLSGQVRPGGGGALLPGARTWRSDAVTAAMARVLSDRRRQGRWWALVSCAADLPAGWPDRGTAVLARPDAVIGPGPRPRVLASDAAGLAGRGGGFDGVVAAPMPLDHPDAWRCYNVRSLRRLRRKARGGVMVLRAQADADHPRAVLSAGKTFQAVVGSGWAGIDFGAGRIDLLLVGPREAVDPPAVRGGYAVPLSRLLSGPMAPARAVRPWAPSAAFRGGCFGVGLRSWLRSLQRHRAASRAAR
jgi:hypothetical protein